MTDAIAAELLAIELDLSMPTGAMNVEGVIVSNLKPLVWIELESTNRLICEVVTPICEYSVWKDSNSVAYSVLYYNRHTEAPTKEATGFATVEEAKEWAWNHYNEKMQPYVKPSPTWIDVNERLPEQNTEVLVRYHAHFDDEEVKEFDFCTAFFYGKLFDVKDQHFYIRRTTKVTHWMPLPELPEGE